MRYAHHFYALAKRITVEGGNQLRVKVANMIFLPLQSNGYTSIKLNGTNFTFNFFLGMKIPLYGFF